MHMHDVSDIQPTHTPTQATHQTVKESPQYKRPLAYIPVISPNNFTDLKISSSRVEKRRTKGSAAQTGPAMKISFVISEKRRRAGDVSQM